MRVVLALGGNALLPRGEPLDVAVQRANVKVAAEAVAEVAASHQVVLTHGNGPQLGLLALQNDAYRDVDAYPLDVLGAESQGMVGYLLEQELGRHIPSAALATLLTQVVVDPSDVAFLHPTKFVGPVYEDEEAHRLTRDKGWAMARDGDCWRRVVPSPAPRQIVELETIRLLMDHGVTVTCVGGGGIPVVPDGAGGMQGVEAVIDKDLAAALLATRLEADVLVLLTDVDGVYEGYGTDAARRLGATTMAELRALDLPSGSMGPKVDALCRFVEHGGHHAAVGTLAAAAALVRGDGEVGTIVMR
jgi:carbamate kinase